MPKVTKFEDLAGEISDYDVRKKLETLYGHPDNIDVFVGGILEDPVPGGRVGPLFKCLLLEQFRTLRDGDRFWWVFKRFFKDKKSVKKSYFNTGTKTLQCLNRNN